MIVSESVKNRAKDFIGRYLLVEKLCLVEPQAMMRYHFGVNDSVSNIGEARTQQPDCEPAPYTSDSDLCSDSVHRRDANFLGLPHTKAVSINGLPIERENPIKIGAGLGDLGVSDVNSELLDNLVPDSSCNTDLEGSHQCGLDSSIQETRLKKETPSRQSHHPVAGHTSESDTGLSFDSCAGAEHGMPVEVIQRTGESSTTVLPSDLVLPLEAIQPAEQAPDSSEQGFKIPPVLFEDIVITERDSVYRSRMQGLSDEHRLVLLKRNLRESATLISAGFLSEEEGLRFQDNKLLDEQDYLGVCVYGLLCFANDLALVREISVTSANSYKRWLASYLESIGHPDAYLVRSWIVPHSNKFYSCLFGFLESPAGASDYIPDEAAQALGKEVSAHDVTVGSFTLDALRQMDLFGSPASGESSHGQSHSETTAADSDINSAQAELLTMYAQQNDELHLSRVEQQSNLGEYSYIGLNTWNIFADELTSQTRKGKPRYKRGEASAIIFQATMMLGLRPAEWATVKLHDGYYDPSSHVTMSCPVIEVRTAKQQSRKMENPLRENRLIVLQDHSPQEINLIRGAIELYQALRAECGSDAKVLANIRSCISYVWSKLVEQKKVSQTTGISEDVVHNGVSLYTARHVFAEELRRTFVTKFELAAMLGHTTTVNQLYYTSRKKQLPRSHAFTLPTAWPSDPREIELWSKSIMNILKKDQLDALMHSHRQSLGGLVNSDDLDDLRMY